MTTFRTQSKEFLRDLSRAAAWMMRRNVGQNHWWRSAVLTSSNPDTDKRPIFDQARADQVFDELIARSLLVERAGDVDGIGVPAYVMKHDIDGWDQAVADGRPVYAQWLKVKRTWLLILLIFLLGCVATTIENRIVGGIDSVIDNLVGAKKE